MTDIAWLSKQLGKSGHVAVIELRRVLKEANDLLSESFSDAVVTSKIADLYEALGRIISFDCEKCGVTSLTFEEWLWHQSSDHGDDPSGS